MIVCKKKKNQFTYLVAVPQFGGSLIGRCATDLAAELQIWPPCYRFGHRVTDLAAMSHIWPPYVRFVHLDSNLASMQQIW